MSKELTKEKGQKEILSECLLGVDKTVLKLGHYIGIYSAMQEYSYQNTKPLIDIIEHYKETDAEYEKQNKELIEEIDELKKEVFNCNRMIGHLEEISINEQVEIAKLKASKSEANEAVEWDVAFEEADKYAQRQDAKDREENNIQESGYWGWFKLHLKTFTITRNNK